MASLALLLTFATLATAADNQGHTEGAIPKDRIVARNHTAVAFENVPQNLPANLLLGRFGRWRKGKNNNEDHTKEELSPVTRLILVLFKTFAVLMIGAFCKEFGFIKPEMGHMQALGFFVGKIGFPLLVFRTVATANVGALDMKVIVACTLAKVVIMLATWLLTFVAYQPTRLKGQRVLTSSVFSFFVVASNDFAVGFPVIDALYGSSMIIYLSANALVAAMLFQPLTMVLFGIGKKMKEDDDGAVTTGGSSSALKTLKEIALNPIIFATILGLIVNICFSSMLVFDGKAYALPHPISDVVDVLTVPFITLALFLTGVSLKAPTITNWTCLLVLMKVFVCAYLSHIFALMLGVEALNLRDFSFFYGMIPTSSGPLIFAKEFDESAVDIIATSILLGLCVAGPNMMVTSMFLAGAGDLSDVFLATLTYSGICSACAGVAFLVLILLTIQLWTRSKLGIAIYSVVALSYTTMLLWMTFSTEGCDAVKVESAWSPVEVLFNTLQKACVMLVFYLEFIHARVSCTQGRIASLLSPLALILLAIVPGYFTKPRTLSEICDTADNYSWSDNLSFALASGFFLLLAVAFALQDFIQTGALRNVKKEVKRRLRPSVILRAREESELSSSFAQPSDGVVNVEDPHSIGQMLRARDGEFTVWALFRIQGVRLLIQFINSVSSMHGQRVMGGFTQMLIIECIMEHAQLVFLIIAVCFDKSFKMKLNHAFGHFFQELDFCHSHGHHVSHHF